METSNLGNLDNIRDRLRAFRAMDAQKAPSSSSHAQSSPVIQQYPGILPVESYISRKKTPADALDEQIQAYLARPVSIGKIDEKFAGLGFMITKDMRGAVTTDFPDNVEMNKPGIIMVRTDPDQIARLGRSVIPMIESGFSRRGAAALFTLAYNATAPGSRHLAPLFPEVLELENIIDIAYNDFSDKILSSIGSATEELVQQYENPAEEAAIYSYIALSLLRLFTKSATNYILAWDHIKRGYSRFYGHGIAISLPTPSETAIRGLSNWFSIEPRAKQTLYRLLYLGNESQNHMGLKRFAYEMHLANTGMHLADMFFNLGNILKCDSSVLLQAINIREFERQVKCLVALVKLVQDSRQEYSRRMWRYGRIFNETFMSDMQTKCCSKLVYIFASALRMVDPKTYDKVLNIVQLSDVSDVNKRKCEDVAARLIEAVGNYHRKDIQLKTPPLHI